MSYLSLLYLEDNFLVGGHAKVQVQAAFLTLTCQRMALVGRLAGGKFWRTGRQLSGIRFAAAYDLDEAQSRHQPIMSRTDPVSVWI